MADSKTILIELSRKPRNNTTLNEDDWFVPVKINRAVQYLYLDTGAPLTWIATKKLKGADETLKAKLWLDSGDEKKPFSQLHADGETTSGFIGGAITMILGPGTENETGFTFACCRADITSRSFSIEVGMLGLCGPAYIQGSPSQKYHGGGPCFFQCLREQFNEISNQFALALTSTAGDPSWIEFGGDLSSMFRPQSNHIAEVNIIKIKNGIAGPEEAQTIPDGEDASKPDWAVGDWLIGNIGYTWLELRDDGSSIQRVTMMPRIGGEPYAGSYDTPTRPTRIDNGWTGLALPEEVALGVNKTLFKIKASDPKPPAQSGHWENEPKWDPRDLDSEGKPKMSDPELQLIIDGINFPIPIASLVRRNNGNWWSIVAGLHGKANQVVLGDAFLKHVVAVHDIENAKMRFRPRV